MTIWALNKKKGENELVTTKEVLLGKADALFDQENYKGIYDLLTNYRDSEDVEILWRLSRALYKMSKTATDVQGKKMIYEAYDLINNALSIKEDHWAIHKWMSVILNSKCSYEGMKVQIRELYNIKTHMLRAVELNPTDATTMYMLGTWCYQVSDLAWYQRKVASVIFGEPPTSSFEEALKYFQNAEKTCAENTGLLRDSDNYSRISIQIHLTTEQTSRRAFSTKLHTASSFTIMTIWALNKKKGENELVTTKEVLLGKADALFDQENYKGIYDLLTNYRDSGDVEILWRLSRALYKMSKTATDVQGKKMI
ncbi:regulator of microtubule dynamics protein 1-like [Megalopta genalis]|uniref:regulator of microtubule dynamics protein 1-like n=1 Tax=Megalopta genalis TaxID=115081 RepID=UPI003FD4F81B